MKRILLIVLALISGICSAQTYKVQNLDVLGTSTLTGLASFTLRPTFNGNTPWDSGNFNPSNYATLTSPSFTSTLGLTGAITSAITSGGASAEFLSNSTPTGQAIYTGICAGCTSYDEVQSTITVPANTTVTGTNGFASYLNDLNGLGTPNSGNAVNYFSVATCAVTNANCWGQNNVLIDNTTYSISSVTGVKLTTAEYDIDVTSPGTNVQGPVLTGSSLVQPAAAVGFTIGSLSVQNPALTKWTFGFVTQDGVANVAAHYGAMAASGSNIASQPVTQNYFDGSGTVRAWTYQVNTSGNLLLSDTGSGHAVQINGNVIIHGASHDVTHSATLGSGATAPILTANKPGSSTAIGTWISVVIDGTQYWLPVWAN